MKSVSKLGCISLVISIVGALNWGLVGLLNFDLVAFLFGHNEHFTKVIYTLVGVSGIYAAYSLFCGCSACKSA
ncbi:MAG: DUF378 domain-containing protein [Gammaproteobacteria bacterium]|nr:DUF378 domain-containing protein [Gammaproteobacteria bacterium]MBP9729132.1 DUF378 domain-containing protein [Gammaproteobacteria bacterium]